MEMKFAILIISYIIKKHLTQRFIMYKNFYFLINLIKLPLYPMIISFG